MKHVNKPVSIGFLIDVRTRCNSDRLLNQLYFTMLSQKSGTSKFSGSKKCVRMRDYVTSFCRIKEECTKHGLQESLDVRICRLVKDGINQQKELIINT